jgi:hypothetical protein
MTSMEAQAVLDEIPSPAPAVSSQGLFMPCPRCGREALMFVENDFTVYEHRPSIGDETREVCIIP